MQLLPEQELLLLCAVPVPDLTRIAVLVDSDLDWQSLLSRANEHRLLPLLYWRVHEIRPSRIPPAASAAFRENLKNSLLLTRELVHVITLLAGSGITAIPYKGPTLALAAYGNLALRNFGDLDLLLRREDIWKAQQVLEEAGYTSKVNLDPGRREAYLGSYDEFVMYSPEGSILELHWWFVPPHFGLDLNFEVCQPRLGSVMVGNRRVPALHPDDLLFVLAVHGAKHCWSHLGMVCDFVWLIHSHTFDWDAALRRAVAGGVHRIILLTAALAQKMFAVQLPEPLARRIPLDPEVEPLATIIAAAFFGTHHDESSIVASGKLHLRMRERTRDRVRYFLTLATRPGVEDFDVIDLPKSLNFLYRLIRFPRLALKYWRR